MSKKFILLLTLLAVLLVTVPTAILAGDEPTLISESELQTLVTEQQTVDPDDSGKAFSLPESCVKAMHTVTGGWNWYRWGAQVRNGSFGCRHFLKLMECLAEKITGL